MDRIVDLSGIPTEYIRKNKLDYLLEDDYLVPEAILIHKSEQKEFKNASSSLYEMFKDCLNVLIKEDRLEELGFPPLMNEMIQYSWHNRHQSILGRFDFGGGVDGGRPRLLEYNADTPTMVPESGDLQNQFKSFYSNPQIDQFNSLNSALTNSFNLLGNTNSQSHHSMLFTTLGYEEDVANLQPIMQAASEAGFDVTYADLPEIEFDEDEGIFIEGEDGMFVQYDYLYKLVPWEFICFEEPELLRILHKLILTDKLYVLNPPHALVFQSKLFLEYVYKQFRISKYLLKTDRNAALFHGMQYVEKVTLGRLGENIKVFSKNNLVIEKTNGDFGHFPKIYQEFTELYKDDDGDLYQGSVFMVGEEPVCLSFRRGEKMIIDDDAQFIPHFIMK